MSTTGSCAACRELSALAERDGKEGYVRCSACLDKEAAGNANRQAAENAKDAAWRTARSLAPDEDRMIASAIMMAAERDTVRRILSAQLPGGEAQFWGMVEEELKQ